MTKQSCQGPALSPSRPISSIPTMNPQMSMKRCRRHYHRLRRRRRRRRRHRHRLRRHRRCCRRHHCYCLRLMHWQMPKRKRTPPVHYCWVGWVRANPCPFSRTTGLSLKSMLSTLWCHPSEIQTLRNSMQVGGDPWGKHTPMTISSCLSCRRRLRRRHRYCPQCLLRLLDQKHLLPRSRFHCHSHCHSWNYRM